MSTQDKEGQHIVSRYWKERHKDSDFLKLRDEWYAKLDEEGFEDIEYVNQKHGDLYTNMLAGPSVGDLHRSDQRKWNIHFSQEYYSRARVHYWDLRRQVEERYQRIPRKVKARLEAWELHAEGASFHKAESFVVKKYGVVRTHLHEWLLEQREAILPGSRE